MMTDTMTKSIAYSYATSSNAEDLGFGKTGCFHISITHYDIEGSGQSQTFMPHNAEGYLDKNDPDLLAQFDETDGDLCKMWLAYGNLPDIITRNMTA